MSHHPDTRFWFFIPLLILASCHVVDAQSPEEPLPDPVELRVADQHDVLYAGGPNLVRVQARYEGSDRWVDARPDSYTVEAIGPATVVEDVSRQPRNPFMVIPDQAGADVTVRLVADQVSAERRFSILEPQTAQSVALQIALDRPAHDYTGIGAGVMFYDNQFNIDDRLFDWCFKDVDTQIVHALIRPDFETTNDNDDWQVLDNDAFDWSACERMFWILWHAKQRNPDLKVYACLYSPPAWMKANDDTAGDAGLKDGDQYKLEMAEYVYAFLKHAEWKGTVIDYLCLFNEPDWPHTQDGSHFKSLTELARTHVQVRDAITRLIDNDPDFDHYPQYVFPETLGAGSITRAGGESDQLADIVRSGTLDHLAAWGVHDYWNTGGYWPVRFSELQRFTKKDDKPIWMTEWAQRFPKSDLASAMDYGRSLLNSLRLGSSVWMAFEWVHPSANQSGLISTQWGEEVPETRYWRSKSYYVFKQIANTSPPGGRCIAMDLTGAALDEPATGFECLAIAKADKLIVHLLNDLPISRPYEITSPELSKPMTAWLTDHQNEFAEQEAPASQGRLPPYAMLSLEYKVAKRD